MTCRILQSALLSLSVSLTGCVAYEVDDRDYSPPRYSSYGYQQPVYPRAYYPQYPRVQEYRYPRAPEVQVYRQPPSRYRAAPLWPQDVPRYQVERSRHRQNEQREARREHYQQQAREERHGPRHEQNERNERRDRHDQSDHESGRRRDARRY